MDRLRKAAILTRLMERLRDRGSWCGETHVQKATLILQELMRVPLGFDFVLYKHGPFSFDLRDELTALRGDEVIELQPQSPYGPRIALTDHTDYIQQMFSKTLERYEAAIAFVAEKVGGKGVAELERLATALFITERAETGSSVDERANQLTKLKPHILPESAVTAVQAVDLMINEARAYTSS